MNFENNLFGNGFSGNGFSGNSNVTCENKIKELENRIYQIEDYLKNKINADNAYKEIHYGINCSNCNVQNIVGIRYKCGHCNYNVCQKCEPLLHRNHNRNHLFIRIHSPNLAYIVDKKII